LAKMRGGLQASLHWSAFGSWTDVIDFERFACR
jgi:hypothetical protein